MQTIPPDFWEPFTRKEVARRIAPDGATMRLMADGTQVYENWELGNFAVRFPDGVIQQVNGVMVEKAGVDRLIADLENGDE